MDSYLFNINPDVKKEEPQKAAPEHQPLAARMRPLSFDDYIGQKHILSKGKLLRRAIESDSFTSIIFHGPPGVGKTSLAEVIAKHSNSCFVRLSGVTSSVSDLRREIASAVDRRRGFLQRTIIFIDELHRFNRAQQDSLLPDIENGNIRFIGATTQNPFFFIISPLLSRSLVFNLEILSQNDISVLINKALSDARGFGDRQINITDEAMKFWCESCEGDARRALNALEIAVLTSPYDDNGRITIDKDIARESTQKKSVNYGDDEHYDTISAFIKSMRGSDPDAAIYWLARMLKSGEDIMFIARRIVIFASEDIGNADPKAIEVAVSVMHAVQMIGMPEAKLLLAHAVTYCATAPKSNASYMAINEAMDDVENSRIQPVPMYLRSKYFAGEGETKDGSYKYPHDYNGHFVDQDYMGVKKKYYKPGDLGYEKKIKERIEYWEQQRATNSKGKSNG